MPAAKFTSSQEKSRIRRLLDSRISMLLGAIFVLVCAFLTAEDFPLLSSKQPSAATVLAEFRSVSSPEGSIDAHQFKTVSKYGVTSVSNRYLVTRSPDLVFAHYSAELAKNGWTFLGHFNSGASRGDAYCKAKLMASIEALDHETGQATSFSFSVSWSSVSEKDCP